MYWVIWSVFQNLRSFPVFPGATWSSCTACIAVFQLLAVWNGESLGDPQGDPMLILSLPIEAVWILPSRSIDLRWVERSQLVICKVIQY